MTQRPVTYLPQQILILRITSICWLLAKGLSYKVWVKDRLFPTFPVVDFLDAVPSVVHLSLFAISIAALVSILFFPAKRQLFIVLFCAELLSCLLDQNRWQPWEYQYITTIFIVVFCNRKPGQMYNLLMLITISTYVFSGLHKLNNGFLHLVWDRMLLASFFKFPAGWIHNIIVMNAGYLLGIIEAGAGLLLLYKKMRRHAATVLIVMHCINLVWLGPTGLNTNNIVWPWNVLMIGWLYCLFFMKPVEQPTTLYMFSNWGRLLLWTWIILPAFSFLGSWDSYLSSDLYSGKLPYLVVCIPDREQVPELQKYMSKHNLVCKDSELMYSQTWGMSEMNIVPYPSSRTNRQFCEKFLKAYPNSNASFSLVLIRDTITISPVQ